MSAFPHQLHWVKFQMAHPDRQQKQGNIRVHLDPCHKRQALPHWFTTDHLHGMGTSCFQTTLEKREKDMLESTFVRTGVSARLRWSPLRPHLDNLLTSLRNEGYAPIS